LGRKIRVILIEISLHVKKEKKNKEQGKFNKTGSWDKLREFKRINITYLKISGQVVQF